MVHIAALTAVKAALPTLALVANNGLAHPNLLHSPNERHSNPIERTYRVGQAQQPIQARTFTINLHGLGDYACLILSTNKGLCKSTKVEGLAETFQDAY